MQELRKRIGESAPVDNTILASKTNDIAYAIQDSFNLIFTKCNELIATAKESMKRK